MQFFWLTTSSNKVIYGNVRKVSKLRHYNTFYTAFSAPLDWHKLTVFKQLCSKNDFIHLEMVFDGLSQGQIFLQKVASCRSKFRSNVWKTASMFFVRVYLFMQIYCTFFEQLYLFLEYKRHFGFSFVFSVKHSCPLAHFLGFLRPVHSTKIAVPLV